MRSFDQFKEIFTMLKPAVLLSLCMALPSLASPVVRTTDVSVPGLGTYKVEVTIENRAVGTQTQSEALMHVQDTPDDGPEYCITSTHFSGVKVVYTLKSSTGSVIAQTSQSADIENRAQSAVSTSGTCNAVSVLGTSTNFFHADQFVDFNLVSAAGTQAKLSVSAFFNGSIQVATNGAYQAVLETASLRSLRYFIDNQGGGTSQLVDPNAPPAPDYVYPDDL
jgi:hypothetical protein